MTFRIPRFLIAAILFIAFATTFPIVAQEQINDGAQNYQIVTFSGLGGTSSAANSINDRGWVMGNATLADNTTMHATIWIHGQLHDLKTLGGDNSSVAWSGVKNNWGLVTGISETADLDPYGEFWSCGLAFFNTITSHICRGFVWTAWDDKVHKLGTLGGNNGVATGINNWGQAVGWAETPNVDATCNSPQVLQFKAVIYGPRPGRIQALEPLPGDPDSAATAINDLGQVVGISGLCSNAVGGLSAQHAVLWEHGVPLEIGNLGGKSWNTPTAINNKGEVVGFSDLPNDDPAHPNYHAFLWTKAGGVKDLGTLPGDTRSIAWGINNRGQIVGQSRRPGSSRAFIYENGVMTELNSLVAPGSPTLVYANDINDRGEIVGGAFDPGTNESPAFLARPSRDHDQTARAESKGNHPSAPVQVPVDTARRPLQRLGLDLSAVVE